MHMKSMRSAAHKARRVGALIAKLSLVAAAPLVCAQGVPAAGPVDKAPSEAAQRAAQSPYRFILLNANAPARKPAPSAASSPAIEAKRAAPAQPSAVDQAALAPPPPRVPTTPTAAAPEAARIASRPAAQPAPALAPALAPEPVAALTPRPAEPVSVREPRRDVIAISTEEPRLPTALLRERPSGTVKVQFEVNPDGSTGGVKVIQSTNRSLNRTSTDAVSRWKFQPVDDVLTVETELVYKFD